MAGESNQKIEGFLNVRKINVYLPSSKNIRSQRRLYQYHATLLMDTLGWQMFDILNLSLWGNMLLKCKMESFILGTCFVAASAERPFSSSHSSGCWSPFFSLCWFVTSQGGGTLLLWSQVLLLAQAVFSSLLSDSLHLTLGSVRQVKPFSFSKVEEHRLPAPWLDVEVVSKERRNAGQVLRSIHPVK